jgi:hypothetical protein
MVLVDRVRGEAPFNDATVQVRCASGPQRIKQPIVVRVTHMIGNGRQLTVLFKKNDLRDISARVDILAWFQAHLLH